MGFSLLTKESFSVKFSFVKRKYYTKFKIFSLRKVIIMSNVNIAQIIAMIEAEIDGWDQMYCTTRIDTPTGAEFKIGPFAKVVLDGWDIKDICESPVQRKKTVSYRTDSLEAAIRRSVRFAVHFHLGYNRARRLSMASSAVAAATVETLVSNPIVAAEIAPTIINPEAFQNATETAKKSKRQHKVETILSAIAPSVIEAIETMPPVNTQVSEDDIAFKVA